MKPIILIGGVSGVGKTTVGNMVAKKMNMDHHLGAGWIRECLRSILDKKEYPELFNYTFQISVEGQTPFQNLYQQSLYMKSATEKCISRAYNEGTSFLIHGGTLIPGLIDMEKVDYHCVLKANHLRKHRTMINSDTHTKRMVSNEELTMNRSIEKDLFVLCEKHNVPIVKNNIITNTADFIVNQISKRIQNKIIK